jgi:MerR family transcriptional regulator, repressor of the yfmOP operon
MTPVQPDRLDQIEATLERVAERLETLAKEQQATNQKLEEGTKLWDERFFQLSRDTLTFTRTIVTTAAVVAIIVPIFRDLIPVLVQQFSSP